MPFYEYRCAQDHVFDARQSFNDDPIAVCPKCGSPALRVIQPVGVVFKGGGWYATDSRKSSSHTVPAADNHDEKPSTSADSGSTESKEAAPASTSTSTSSTTKTSSGDAAPAL